MNHGWTFCICLQPSSEVPSTVQSGFVFRENKFAADPTLPFGSLAMPAFEKVSIIICHAINMVVQITIMLD